MEKNKNWNEIIKSLRKSYGVTQQQIADLLEIKKTNYCAIETGKRKCSEAMKERIEIILEKFSKNYEMDIIFDYFRVSFPTKDYKEIIVKVLAMNVDYFVVSEHAFYGYTTMLDFADIRVMTGSKEDNRGTLIELKGKGCRFVEKILNAQGRTWKDLILACLRYEGKFTRVDIAINDMNGILDIPELLEKVKRGDYKSLFDTYHFYESGSHIDVLDDKENLGTTIYLGSFKSEIYFCIYQKDYEQYIKNGIPIEEAKIKNRFEIRLKNDRAFMALMNYIDNEDMESTAFGIITRYLTFYESDDKKPVEEREIDPRWAWFIGDGREAIKLTMKPEEYTIDKTIKWLFSQVAPTLALVDKIGAIEGVKYIEHMKLTKLPDKQQKLLKQFMSANCNIYDVIDIRDYTFDKKDLYKLVADEKEASRIYEFDMLKKQLAEARKAVEERDKRIAYLENFLPG